ncbi:endolytic transglycosylase MltG [Gemmatimonas phototrophica]|uniref:Endolytic murein transglycosylase n=1 Tax=Gemmatimonas phototrophica TaxID=1379270 RepID=A0A143BI13_9BACT|nr:endolytic transglycosylase MltG [Gemmatimonas phototrophica]AMW04245.1 hypothetical protein GEMMAAP_04110 [Gemmatimonas phototrophica]
MPRKKSKNSRVIRLAVLAAAIVMGAWVWREIGGGASPSGAVARVVVPKGASVRVAADSLEAQGVIGSPVLFRLFARLTGSATDIKPGTYRFASDAGYRDVLNALVTGRGLVRTVVIPEGFDLRDITPVLAKALRVPEDSVRAAVTDSAWLRELNVPVPSLEGYLFPATYSFADGTSAREAVNAMIERFLDVWKPEWDARLKVMAISRHDAMAMASIIEKEARKPEERPLISAVYWNRVKKRMLLQADPTVQYALPQHVGRVLYKDLEVESKYNTYKYPGLPPGPIANPGEASIAAALAPADVPYLFFVARADGGHEFTETFAQHTKAIAQIKAAKRAAAAVASGRSR